MTVKQFFKSTSFKCIISLLCILLVCGIFLTIAYGFLEVTDEMRFERAIAKIYGEKKQTTPVEYTDEDGKLGTATILEAYIDGDENYLIKSKGTGGFGGTVTCWVLVEVSDTAITRVGKVVVETSDGETLLGSIDFLDKYPQTDYTDGYTYTTDNGFVTSGATLSSNAINNSVNGAVSFVKAVCFGEEDPYAVYAFRTYIDLTQTTWKVDDGIITYNIVTLRNGPASPFTIEITVGVDKKISSYNITTYGSTNDSYDEKINVSLYIGKGVDYFKNIIGEDGETADNSNYADNDIQTGATKSNHLCLCAGAFATANYDYCLKNLPEVN